jgi:hypothetical protein
MWFFFHRGEKREAYTPRRTSDSTGQVAKASGSQTEYITISLRLCVLPAAVGLCEKKKIRSGG